MQVDKIILPRPFGNMNQRGEAAIQKYFIINPAKSSHIVNFCYIYIMM